MKKNTIKVLLLGLAAGRSALTTGYGLPNRSWKPVL